MADGWLEMPFALCGQRIYVAGHKGMVGSALVRRLGREACEVLTSDFDLRDQVLVDDFMRTEKPDVVIIAAAKVGGIGVNAEQPADFITDNLLIQTHLIKAAHEAGVQKLLFLGSSCIYPKFAEQPIKEEALLSGPLEPSNQAYAVAKIAGIEMCQSYRRQYGSDFIAVMPCNLYGPGDRFDEKRSHVIPALMMRAHEAKVKYQETLTIWGSGRPLREFLYVDDLAEACVFAVQRYSHEQILNIGSGQDIAIADLAQLICDVVGFKGRLVFDTDKPDGTPRKLMESSRIAAAGWKPEKSLQEGLVQTYAWYLRHVRDINIRTVA